MAAPKVAGCFFGGDLQGEPKPVGRLPGNARLVRNRLAQQTKQNPAGAGRDLFVSRGA